MTDTPESGPVEETMFRVHDSELQLSLEELEEQLSLGTRINNCTVSRQETRQPADFNGNQYFLSVNLNFEAGWDLIDSMDVDSRREANMLMRQHIHAEVMKKEAWISGVLLHMQLKDRVNTFPRDNVNNPACSAPNLTEAVKALNANK